MLTCEPTSEETNCLSAQPTVGVVVAFIEWLEEEETQELHHISSRMLVGVDYFGNLSLRVSHEPTPPVSCQLPTDHGRDP